MRSKAIRPSYEFILQHFQAQRGLYILGAGASVGTAPFGAEFSRVPSLDYLRNFASFPAIIPVHDELTARIIESNADLSISEIWPHLEIRPGTEVPPYLEILQRMPRLFTRLKLKHRLAEALFLFQTDALKRTDSYAVFQLFRPSLIATYNHDGLAAHFCGHVHLVLDMHGTIEPEYGSPSTADFVAEFRDVDLPAPPDDVLMYLPEAYFDRAPAQRRFRRLLSKVESFSPDFIAIIGYSFFQSRTGYLDSVSLNSFLEMRRNFRGNIYIIQPEPDALSAMIADALKSNAVIPISAHWNVLAHAIMQSAAGRSHQKSLHYICQQLLDKHGDKVAFPRPQ